MTKILRSKWSKSGPYYPPNYAVRHLEFLKVGNFTCLAALEGQCASLRQVSRQSVKRSGDITIFRFFKMATVRHLGFVLRVFGPPTKSI